MTRTFRTRLAKPGDEPHSHLGEAETLAIISCRSMRAVFVTDDTAVPVIASEQKIPVATTFELLRVAHRGGMVDADTLWSHIQTLRRERRAPAHLRDRAAFDTWLSS